MNATNMQVLVDNLLSNDSKIMKEMGEMSKQMKMMTENQVLFAKSLFELKESSGTSPDVSKIMKTMTKNHTILADLVSDFYESRVQTTDMCKQMKMMTDNQLILVNSVSEMKERCGTSSEISNVMIIMNNIYKILDMLVDQWNKSKGTTPDMIQLNTLITDNFASLAKLVKESREHHYAKNVRRYDGKTNIELWLLEMQQNLLLLPPSTTEMQKVDFIKAYMTGEVLHILGRTRFTSVEDICKRMRDIYRTHYRIYPQGQDEPTDQFLIRLSIAVKQKFGKYKQDDPNVISKRISRYMLEKGQPDLVKFLLKNAADYVMKQQQNRMIHLNRN